MILCVNRKWNVIALRLPARQLRNVVNLSCGWALLNNRDIRDKYVLELRNKFETLQEKTEISTPNDEYEISWKHSVTRQQSVFQQNLKLNIESHGKR